MKSTGQTRVRQDARVTRTAQPRKGPAVAIDPDALSASLRRLATVGEPGAGVVQALQQVTEACVDLFGVTGSGIMLADQQNVPRYVAASEGPGRMLEVVESDTGQGPCTEAFVNNTLVASADVTAEGRWPDLASALRPHAVRAVLGLPVRLGGVTVGTLDVFYDRPHMWQDDECQALARYRDVVESTLAAAVVAHNAGELASQLQYALDYRVIIERGVGYLMARDQVDSMTAFNKLRRAARDTQSKIGDVAQRLVSTGRLPAEAPR
jgi:transcriptional regulator with GAF, ATPase, and Fis domain